MEIEPEKFKNIILGLFRQLRELDEELFVHRYVIHLANQSGLVDPAMPWDAAIRAAKQNPALADMMEKKYKPLIDGLTQVVDQAELQSKVLELLRQWKPTGPPN